MFEHAVMPYMLSTPDTLISKAALYFKVREGKEANERKGNRHAGARTHAPPTRCALKTSYV